MALSTALRALPVQTPFNGSKDDGYPRHNRREAGPEPVEVCREEISRSSSSQARVSRTESDAGMGSSGSATLLEAALDAWADCQPDGYTLPEDAVRLVLPSIACRVPGAYQVPGTSQMLKELFTAGATSDESGEQEPAVFVHMLKAHNGTVHFLYFWSAFSKAARLLASLSEGQDTSWLLDEEGLTLELETLRDSILRSLDAEETTDSTPATSSDSKPRSSLDRSMSTSQLVEAIQVAASMSSAPGFWEAAERNLKETGGTTRLSMEALTVVILTWLREAIAWQHEQSAQLQSPPPEEIEVHNANSGSQKNVASDETPVFLHIYDVSQEEGVQKVNRWLASKNSMFKFGGIFHAGVEVNGLEWSYGMTMNETMSGISCVEPRTHPAHNYRQTVKLRSTKLSGEEIAELLSQLIEEYPGDDYDLLRRNCCHFADDFSRRLGAGRIPGWIHRLARVGARVDSAMQAVTGRKLINLEDDSD